MEFTLSYPGPQGYVLDVSPAHVVVAGYNSSGTFYGVQSMIQLLFRDEENGLLKVKPAKIVDFPDMPLRWGETFNPSTTIQRLQEGRIRDGQKVRVTFSYITCSNSGPRSPTRRDRILHCFI